MPQEGEGQWLIKLLSPPKPLDLPDLHLLWMHGKTGKGLGPKVRMSRSQTLTLPRTGYASLGKVSNVSDIPLLYP